MNKTSDNFFQIAQKNVAITGAGGFIGSHLTEALLQKGANVKALVRYNSKSDAGWLKHIEHKNLQLCFGDVTDAAMMNEFLGDVDCVFHLAALIGIPYSYHAPQSYINSNVSGTLNILQAAANNKLSRIILTSTSEVYGTAQFTPMPETHPLQAQSPYSASKIAADMLGISFARSFGLPVTLVRPFNTFGPRQSMRAVIPTIIVQALTGKSIQLGNLTPVRDFNFVADTASGFIAAAERGKTGGDVYNLATGNGISIEETAKLVLRLCNSSAKLVNQSERTRKKGSEVEKLIGDATLAGNELGWKPEHSFENGLQKTIEWIEQNLDKFPESDLYVK